MIKPWIIFKIWKHYTSPSVAKQHTFAMTQSWDLHQHSQLYRKDTETGYLNYRIKFFKMNKRKKEIGLIWSNLILYWKQQAMDSSISENSVCRANNKGKFHAATKIAATM